MKSQKRIRRGLSQAAARCATSKLLFGGSGRVPRCWDRTKTAFRASLESSGNMATRALQPLQPHGLFIKCQGGKRKKEELQRGCWRHCKVKTSIGRDDSNREKKLIEEVLWSLRAGNKYMGNSREKREFQGCYEQSSMRKNPKGSLCTTWTNQLSQQSQNCRDQTQQHGPHRVNVPVLGSHSLPTSRHSDQGQCWGSSLSFRRKFAPCLISSNITA